LANGWHLGQAHREDACGPSARSETQKNSR
jgi:hypothetical protein